MERSRILAGTPGRLFIGKSLMEEQELSHHFEEEGQHGIIKKLTWENGYA